VRERRRERQIKRNMGRQRERNVEGAGWKEVGNGRVREVGGREGGSEREREREEDRGTGG